MCQDEVKSVATSYKWIHNQITKGLSKEHNYEASTKTSQKVDLEST